MPILSTARAALAALVIAATALVVRPPDARGAASGQANFGLSPVRIEVDARPGRPLTDAIEVTNEARETARLRVYAEDWRLERDGAVAFSRAGTGRRSASTWVRINPTEFDLPAGSTSDVRFTVTVPAGAPAGSYRSAIVVEQVPRRGPGDVPGSSVSVRPRVATILYVRVGDPIPDGAITALVYRGRQGLTRTLRMTVTNPGGVHFRTKGKILLEDPATKKVLYKLDIPDAPVLPESVRDVPIAVPPAVKPGTYHVRAELEIGRPEILVHEDQVTVD